jgi:hypothetical protein
VETTYHCRGATLKWENMKRIIIICEGETEQEFCKDVLQPYFQTKQKFIAYPTIKKSGGGIVAWETLKKQIEMHLKQEPTAIVTTFIDYYGLNGEKNKFPQWEFAKTIVDKNKRMDFLEHAMLTTLDESLRFRFIPYIQLHEFEGLLFNNIEVFNSEITPQEFSNYNYLVRTINDNPNPELINEGKYTAPSKRLMQIIIGYNKPVYGAILAEKIGLTRMRNKSPRFNQWINILETAQR